jgi:hypothetical protein
MTEQKENWLKGISFFILIGLLIYSIYNCSRQQENYTKSLKEESIALVTRIENSGKHRKLKYYFYTDKKILSQTQTRNYEGDPYDLIGRFFKVKYKKDDPQENEIILEKELELDSITLIRAGFTKTKYYFYDAGVTCKYIEKSKWK